jgi:hypothetical protein
VYARNTWSKGTVNFHGIATDNAGVALDGRHHGDANEQEREDWEQKLHFATKRSECD